MNLLVARLNRERHAAGEGILFVIEDQPPGPVGQAREDVAEVPIDRGESGHEGVVLQLLVLLDPLKEHHPLPREHLFLLRPLLDAGSDTVALLDREHVHRTDLL
ncbi:hypothetical protein DSECCO2_478060 [anaerobic digester metagenome]